MNHPLVKKLLPHGIAIVVFLAVALLYCKPALDGKVLLQDDVSKWEGAIQNSKDYAAAHNGKYPLWTNSMFGGMPTFQIGGVGGSKILGYGHIIMTLNLPKPVHFFFLACICFYILCCCLKINPWVGIATSLAYAYATYNPIIISVGHDTKMLAIAYMPAVLAGISLILNKKYWLGAILTILFTGLMVSVNHLQIFYYLFIAIGIMAVSFLIYFIKEKEFKHIVIAAVLSIASIAIGVGCNAEILMGTFEYQKETQRGGASILTDTTKKEKSTSGLSKDYAFSYSMYKTEPLVLLFPKLYGGSNSKMEFDEEGSKAIAAYQSAPSKEISDALNQARLLPNPTGAYWGGIGGTSGPPYAGAIICFLAIVAMFVIEGKHKWWMLSAIVLTCLMSWGSYFDGFNTFLYNNLPLYNKFRAPSMILVVPQLLLTLLASLGLHQIVTAKDKKILMKPFIYALATTGVFFMLGFVFYFTQNFIGLNDQSILDYLKTIGQPEALNYVNNIVDGLVADRKGLALSTIFRSLGFIVLAAGLVYITIKNIVKPIILTIAIALFAFLDVVTVSSKYLNEDNYLDKEEKKTEFLATAKDNEILADKSDFRVFNRNGDRFAESATSYLYKSIGGYHSAKLINYQDLIDRQMSTKENPSVLNMLNAKYEIQKDDKEKTQAYRKRDGAMGSAWFVKGITYVKDADAEMKALDSFDVKATAFVQEQFKSSITLPIEYDSASNIKLIKNDNDYVEYESNSSKNGFGVFSEIYYKAGWKSFVDGKEMPIVKTNYALRGMALPAGKHKLEFKFAPEGLKKGASYSMISNILLWLGMLSLIGFLYLENKKTNLINATSKN
jgi:Bacterial membrane protein YfhO